MTRPPAVPWQHLWQVVRVLAVALLVAALTSCSSGHRGAARLSPPQLASGAPVVAGPALPAARALAVTRVTRAAGYRRAAFGPAWADVDRNGCDTRDDVLRRDLSGVTTRAGTGGCVVLSGRLHDPYTGRELDFRKSAADQVQIDHVVALADAWRSGASAWNDEQRLAFANDPLDLLAVDGPTNHDKGDDDAAHWLPPLAGYRCPYAARQVAVKTRYHLTVTAPERDALVRVLSSCPGEALP